MAIPTAIPEDGGDADGTTSTVEDTGRSHKRRSLVDMVSSDRTRSRSEPPSPVRTRRAFEDVPPLPAKTRSYGKAKKTKDREPFYKGFGVVYLPGDINGVKKKLQLLAAEFFAGNTTVRNELVHVLDALLRLK